MKKTLVGCKTYQEAVLILDSRKAHPAIRKNIELAFKISDPDNKILPSMLQEMENHMQKDDDNKAKQEMEHQEHEDDKKKLAESIKTETEENRTQGETGQSDGRTLDAVKPPGDGSHNAQENAQEQKGTTQLGEAVQQVADQGSADPMNTCVITKMSNGMSEVEAQNSCAKEKKSSEGIITEIIAKKYKHVFDLADKKFAKMSEVIQMQDKKIEELTGKAGKQEGVIQMKGYSEGLQNLQAAPGTKGLGSQLSEIKSAVDMDKLKLEMTQKYGQYT